MSNAERLSHFMSTNPEIRLWDILQTNFKAKALKEKVYIEYDKVLSLIHISEPRDMRRSRMPSSA
ncbi:hypothetical protein JMUB7525_17960 [Staphylococcus aureus]